MIFSVWNFYFLIHPSDLLHNYCTVQHFFNIGLLQSSMVRSNHVDWQKMGCSVSSPYLSPFAPLSYSYLPLLLSYWPLYSISKNIYVTPSLYKIQSSSPHHPSSVLQPHPTKPLLCACTRCDLIFSSEISSHCHLPCLTSEKSSPSPLVSFPQHLTSRDCLFSFVRSHNMPVYADIPAISSANNVRWASTSTWSNRFTSPSPALHMLSP